MAFSPSGKKKVGAHMLLLLMDVVVLALSARVNLFQEFFFIADLFPFALSIVTLVLLSFTITIDFALENAYTGRPQFEIGFFGCLSIFWLAFNAFSTSRWRLVPLKCDMIPPDFPDERIWCKDLQALKAFVWVEFLSCFLITGITLRYSLTQSARGNKHIFKMPLSRYRPDIRYDASANYARDSEFLQFEKLS